MKLKNPLLKVLTKMANAKSIGATSYVLYLRLELAKLGVDAWVKDIVRTLESIRADSQTTPKIKEVIEKIFSSTDPRDLNWRLGECNCPSCQCFRNPSSETLEKALESIEELKKKTKKGGVQ